MHLFTTRNISFSRFGKSYLWWIILVLFSTTSHAQNRAYTKVFSDNMKGSAVIFGNTLMTIVDSTGHPDTLLMNDSRSDGNSIYGNDGEDMEFVDLDGNTGNGAVTRNSSSSDLILPAGKNTIVMAKLYWGGRVADSDYDLSKTNNRSIKIRKGTSNPYSDVIAAAIDTTTVIDGYTEYLASADITSFIQGNGAGTYEVGNVPLSTGAIFDGGNHGGWSIVVVYQNNSLPYNSVRVFDGFQTVYNGGDTTTSTITLTGLDVPSGALQSGDAKMGVLALEGDANLWGDFLAINGNLLWNQLNPPFNPWNGSITDNGVFVHSKNPDFTNQMGIDIDMFDVGTGYGILPNANSVTLQFGTQADKYFPCVFTFTIRMKDPTITLEKTVADANKDGAAQKGEVLTYTLKGGNNGPGSANDIVLIDTLPNTITYKPGTLKVISSPGVTAGIKTDQTGDDIAEYRVNGPTKSVVFRIGTGATRVSGGTLAANEMYEVQFQVTVNDPGSGNSVPPILNIARVTSSSDAGVNFVDDGTAILNPEAGPLPVTLIKFDAGFLNENQVKLNWATSMEINCRQFVIQRSFDGIVFNNVQSIPGNGTTNLFHSYTAIDNINSVDDGTVYYRLKQIDFDGKENFSRIIPLKIEKRDHAIISPNPFNDYLNIILEWNKTELITAKIFTVPGKEVFSKDINILKGINSLKIDGLTNLPKGTYFLQLLSSTKSVIEKITK